MKLIIDIPDEVYKDGTFLDYFHVMSSELVETIYNGTPLEDIRTDVHRHKMDFYPSDYTLINTLIDKWINRGVDI